MARDAEYLKIEVPIVSGCVYDEMHERKSAEEACRIVSNGRVIIYCKSLSKGKHHFSIPLTVVNSGTFHVNPATVSLIYDSSVVSCSDAGRIEY